MDLDKLNSIDNSIESMNLKLNILTILEFLGENISCPMLLSCLLKISFQL